MVARSPIRIFLAVQKALFIRELSMRFSTSKSGLFWTFFEPFMQVLAMVLVKLLLFGRASDNFDFAAFLALNFTVYNLFKNIIQRSINTFSANKALFIYKQVKPIDTIIARAMVELYISAIIALIFISIAFYFGFDLNVKNLPMVIFGVFTIFIASISLSILIAVLNHFNSSIGKLVGIGLIFLMFGSAVFYSVGMLPYKMQQIVLLNPIAHIMEIVHGYYFYTLDDSYVNYSYIFAFILSCLAIGLSLYKSNERKIVSS
jgi:capsular polysaccharide transport system permease protein